MSVSLGPGSWTALASLPAARAATRSRCLQSHHMPSQQRVSYDITLDQLGEQPLSQGLLQAHHVPSQHGIMLRQENCFCRPTS